MKFQAFVGMYSTVVVVGDDFMQYTGSLNLAENEIITNVHNKTKRGDMYWILDHDGYFFELTSLGMTKPTILQILRIKSKQEKYRIEPPIRITVGQLSIKMRPLKNQKYKTWCYANQLKKKLTNLDEHIVIDEKIMVGLLGEKN